MKFNLSTVARMLKLLGCAAVIILLVSIAAPEQFSRAAGMVAVQPAPVAPISGTSPDPVPPLPTVTIPPLPTVTIPPLPILPPLPPISIPPLPTVTIPPVPTLPQLPGL